MTNATRPWTRFYPPGTPDDLGPLQYPHMPAAIREASATYAKQQAFTLALPNGSQGSITFEETDRLSLLTEAFKNAPLDEHREVVRRLLTHADVERVLCGLVRSFFAGMSGDVMTSAGGRRALTALFVLFLAFLYLPSALLVVLV